MKRGPGAWAVGILLWMAACRSVPGLAGLWQGAATAARMALHRLTAAAPFPLIEPLALAFAGLLPSRGGLRRAAWALTVAAGMYALLWYPAYWAGPLEAPPEADAARLERLCRTLTDAMADAPDFGVPMEAAGAVAGLDGVCVKPARYPEWMAALGVSGLFSPWTGEVVVDVTADPACLPFTCVHELMHLKGVADEGAANLAAYRACLDRGGAYAWSARLWALRSALARLEAVDPDARARAAARLTPALATLLGTSDAPARRNPVARWLGIGPQTSDYDALADWLAAGIAG